MAELLSASTPIDAAKGDLVLQILGGPRDGQVVRLRSAKCIIGSSPNCSLRVVARGIRPVHCLVLRGSQATVARSWAPDTRLNGRSFTDAPLVPGDLLSIGPVDFMVLECPAVLESQLRAREAAQETRQAAFEAQQAAFDQERRDWETQRAALPQDPPSPEAALPSPEAPLTSAEIFRRLGISIPSDEEAESTETGPTAADRPRQPSQVAEGPGGQEEPLPLSDGDEESVDQYMLRLLARTRQNGGARPAVPSDQPDVAQARAVPEYDPDPAASVSFPPTASPDGPSRKGPPEPPVSRAAAAKPVDLSALRELANLSAEAAIDRHTRRRLISLSTGKLSVAVVALSCGGWLLTKWWFFQGGDVALYGGAMGILVAVVWGLQHVLLAGRAHLSRSRRHHGQAAEGKPPADQDPPTPDSPAADAAQAPSDPPATPESPPEAR